MFFHPISPFKRKRPMKEKYTFLPKHSVHLVLFFKKSGYRPKTSEISEKTDKLDLKNFFMSKSIERGIQPKLFLD